MTTPVPTIINNFNGSIGQVINHVDNFYAASPSSKEPQTPAAETSATSNTASESTPSDPSDRAVEDISYEPIETYCQYINLEKLAELGFYSPSEFENKLREASAHAPELADFLKHNEKLGYLYFKGHSKADIFRNLCTYFPDTIKFKYKNFATYF